MLSRGRREFLNRILGDTGREYPHEVEEMVRALMADRGGVLGMTDEEFETLVKSLLKSEDDRTGDFKIGGVIRR